MTDNGWSTPLRVDAAACSLVGKVREHNEDAARVEPEIGLYAVADGLGGHRAGERASNLAVETLSEALNEARREGREPDLDTVLAGFDRANAGILGEAEAKPERAGMGTTLTAIVLSGSRLLVGHVGDSRLWRVRDGKIEQLTVDHTVVAQQVRDGILTAEDAEDHPMRHVLSRCLGVQGDVEVDLAEGDLAADDAYVLASDGLVPTVGPEEIARVVREADDAEAAARLLADSACERDGQDNITALVVVCRDA